MLHRRTTRSSVISSLPLARIIDRLPFLRLDIPDKNRVEKFMFEKMRVFHRFLIEGKTSPSRSFPATYS